MYAEWNSKVAGFVGYGVDGGARAVEHLRQILSQVSVATVSQLVALSLFTDFENMSEFKPAAVHEEKLDAVLDQLLAWAGALRPVRAA
ncbi:NADPH-dependent FMN reductase [Nonomuraea sp. CA-141351]|uniref:NADPH-dependent FMN reductase n=1 Tax=Nonomuraea sp. CA-141351 TaxID=3239996 RepID=UPI003D89CD47